MNCLFRIAALVLILSGCSNTRITSSWKPPAGELVVYKKILVLGLMGEPDRMIREKMEEHLVRNLKTIGYDAACACSEFGPATFENLTETQALERLANSGIDAVLTVVLLNKSRERFYIPGRINYSPYFIFQDRFYGYYNIMNERINSQGYYAVDTKYFWESNLYTLDAKKLRYSVQSQTFDPASAEVLTEEYGRIIINDMVRNGVLIKQQARNRRLGF